MKRISLFVPHYISNITKQKVSSEYILSGAPTELHYIERSAFQKDKTEQNDCNFDEKGLKLKAMSIPCDCWFLKREREGEKTWRDN